MGYCTPQLGWQEFRLSTSEEEDLSERILRRVNRGPAAQAEWLRPMVDLLRTDACGHVGLFRCLLDHLVGQFPYVQRNPPTLPQVMRYYFGAMFDSWVAERFFQWPSPSAEHAEVTRDVIQRVVLDEDVPIPGAARGTDGRRTVLSPSSSSSPGASSSASPSGTAGDDLHAAVVRKLLRVPVLVDVGGFAKFASNLHRRFYLRQLYPSAVRKEEFVAEIDEWVLRVLQTFEPLQLSNPNSAGTDGFPKEGMLQHQFWRGASMCLPPNHRIAAEVSQIVDKGRSIAGEVDFWINSELQWAVELLRQGSRKGEHMGRFQEKGVYRILEPKHWRVIDFRAQDAHPHREEGYIAVMIRNDYKGARVELGQGRAVDIDFHGKYVPSKPMERSGFC
jgi:hypothetical protein